MNPRFSIGYLLSLVGLALLVGVFGTLFIMHFIVGVNAIDSTSMYTVSIGGEKVSCLTLGSVNKICGVSREILDQQRDMDATFYSGLLKDADRCITKLTGKNDTFIACNEALNEK